MELNTLLRAVRKQAISECQAMVRANPDDDRYVLAARMSDLKLVKPHNPEITKMKQEYKNGTQERNNQP